PGAEGLPQDDLLPLLEEEISGPPFLIEFGQQLTQNRESSAVFDARLGFSRPLVLVQDPGGQLIDMGDINTCDQCGVHQRGQTGTQVHSEVLGEGRQEDRFVVSLPKPLGKVLDPVQGDNRLPGASASGDSSRTAEFPLHELALSSVEVDLPVAEASCVKSDPDVLVVGGDGGPGKGCIEILLVALV